jgi:hypothetical protein
LTSIKLLFILAALFFLSGCGVEHIATKKGLDCVISYSNWFRSDITCNWDEYNLRTSYGCGAELTVDNDYDEFYKE